LNDWYDDPYLIELEKRVSFKDFLPFVKERRLRQLMMRPDYTFEEWRLDEKKRELEKATEGLEQILLQADEFGQRFGADAHPRTVLHEDASAETLGRETSGAGSVKPSLDRLVEKKLHVGIPTAARYLERSEDHVRRLVRNHRLVRCGMTRPIQVSTKSLRKYKGAEHEPT
jgi:hypothetical protein